MVSSSFVAFSYLSFSCIEASDTHFCSCLMMSCKHQKEMVDTQIISFAPHTFRPMMMMMMTGQSDSPLVLQIFGHDDELLQCQRKCSLISQSDSLLIPHTCR